jgi:hypothetical protein
MQPKYLELLQKVKAQTVVLQTKVKAFSNNKHKFESPVLQGSLSLGRGVR